MLLHVLDDTTQRPRCHLLERGRWGRLTGTLPAARTWSGMCFDTESRRFVLHGGQWLRQNLADVWEWNGSWRRRSPKTSLERWGHSFVFDGRRCVCVGGWRFARGNGITPLDDVHDFGALQAARVFFYGAACGAAQSPRVDVRHKAWLGQDVELRLATTQRTTASILFSSFGGLRWGRIDLPFDLTGAGMPGCRLYVAPAYVAVLTGSRVRYRIPPQTSLVGVALHHQIASLVPQVNPAGLAWSRHLELQIGKP